MPLEVKPTDLASAYPKWLEPSPQSPNPGYLFLRGGAAWVVGSSGGGRRPGCFLLSVAILSDDVIRRCLCIYIAACALYAEAKEHLSPSVVAASVADKRQQ